MRFSFDEDHRLFASALRELLEKECTPQHVREAGGEGTGRSTERWRRLAEAGVIGLTVPKEHGGLGMDEIGLALLLEESGRAALPEPLVETTAVGVPLLTEVGDDETRARWLPAVAEGKAILTVGLVEDQLVADAHVADLLLLRAGDKLHAVAADAVKLTPQPSLDPTRRLFAVDWKPVRETRIAGGEDALQATDAAFDRGALAVSLQLLGIAARLVELGAAYAKERHQFGKPIGSFQAVSHQVADSFMDAENARSLAMWAAAAIDSEDEDAALAAATAKAFAAEAAVRACERAIQVHGGIGFTWEHVLHRYYKRAQWIAAFLDTSTGLRAETASMLLG